MPTLTKIAEQKRNADRRNIHLDGKFAFAVNLNVIARFRLREGLQLSDEQVQEIVRGEVRQKCFDKAIEFVARRPHGREELRRKLARKQEWGEDVIAGVLDDLARMNYLDDARYARQVASTSAAVRKHGRNRAAMELRKRGLDRETARDAVEKVYEETDSAKLAREFAQRQLPRLSRLEPHVAKRRLYGALLRRGFEYDVIKPVVEEVLGGPGDERYDE